MTGSPLAFSHLSKMAKEVLALGKQERLLFAKRDWWIDYPAATALLEDLRRILDGPRAARAECRLIVGDSNNGKSAIAAKFNREHPATHDEATGVTRVPVLYIPVLPEPTREMLYIEILNQLRVPWSPREKLKQLRQKVYRQIEDLDIRMLILDEFNIIKSLPGKKLTEFLTEIRTLTVYHRLSIILFTSKEGVIATQSDAAFQNRFVPKYLVPWNQSVDLRTFIAKYEGRLPLPEPSNLADDEFMNVLSAESEGLIGELKQMLVNLATFAIQNDKSKIDPGMLKDIQWVAPSKRGLEVSRAAR